MEQEDILPIPHHLAPPSKTPGKAEGDDDSGSSRPYPNKPGKTPGVAEGEDFYDDDQTADFDEDVGRPRIAGEEFSDPGTAMYPEPTPPDR